ncbi:MAG: glycosidase [Moorellales bacterium]
MLKGDALFLETENKFREVMAGQQQAVSRLGEVDLVVGIPFYNETDTLVKVATEAIDGVSRFYPESKAALICVGSPAGARALKVFNATVPGSAQVQSLAFLLPDQVLNGRGWAIRAILEIAHRLGADLALLEADLVTDAKKGEGLEFQGQWLAHLLQPVREGALDLVLGHFQRHYCEATVTRHLVYPLLAALYGCRVHDPLSGVMAVRHRLLKQFLENPKIWHGDVGGYGVDPWLVTTAICEEARIGEARLGTKPRHYSSGKRELVFRQVAKTLFESYIAQRKRLASAGAGAVECVSLLGVSEGDGHPGPELHPKDIVLRFRQGFNLFYSTLLPKVLPEPAFEELAELAETPPESFSFSARLWAQTVYSFLLAFKFREEITRGDLLNALVYLYQGRLAGYLNEVYALKPNLKHLPPERAEHLISLEAERLIEEQVQEFIRQRPAFLKRWKEEEEGKRPILPKVTYHEFIPGVPLVLPQEVVATSGEKVELAPIYEEIVSRYRHEFTTFVQETLGLPAQADSAAIAQAVRRFLKQGETLLAGKLLRGDLHTVEGTRRVVEAIFEHLPHGPVFALSPEVISQLLWTYPPVNLLTRLGYEEVGELFSQWSPQEALALASWSEEREYMDQIWDWLRNNARPEHFITTRLQPLVVSYEDFPSLAEMKEASALSRLTGTIVVSNLRKGRGGDFPYLRYFTLVSKHIVEAERFSAVWQQYAHERKDFASRLINSLVGHWGRSPLSAHNFFENGHQRVLVQRFVQMAADLSVRAQSESASELGQLARFLQDMASSYHLAQTMPDGRFIPCSAWTWASFSFKGGRGVPTPLSLHVERDWFTRELVEAVYAALGGDPAGIEALIAELMGEGREAEELTQELWGTPIQKELLLVQRLPAIQPPAGRLVRYSGNPILAPVPEHWWESKYVLNAGSLRLNGKVYLFYRAVGNDEVSRIGLAISANGFDIEERLPDPVFVPVGEEESRGCEDPRVVVLDGRLYMLYTAYDGTTAQIALASISCEDFLARRWERWQRHGMVFPGFWNKDAVLFPVRFNERYALYHRIVPSIWLTYAHSLNCPWPEEQHHIVIGPRSGMMWDALKIGAGSQPLRTRYGWLLIYHGVDYSRVYRLGVLLVAPDDPGRVLYRSPNPILEPETEHEIGQPGVSWVPNVVFTCGAVPRQDKEVLEDEDEILVYYGAADTVIGVAVAKVADLIPLEVRRELKARLSQAG